jgi:hypothetical protein
MIAIFVLLFFGGVGEGSMILNWVIGYNWFLAVIILIVRLFPNVIS